MTFYYLPVSTKATENIPVSRDNDDGGNQKKSTVLPQKDLVVGRDKVVVMYICDVWVVLVNCGRFLC